MFDGSAGWDFVTSLRFGRVLEQENYLWYEEPMREFDLISYTKLCHDLEIPVLAAETSDGCHWNAATWIENKALDMMRTSIDYKGGISGAIKIAHLAESFGMRAQVHGMGWGNAQLCGAIVNNDYYEQIVIDEAHIRGLKSQAHLPIIDGNLHVPQEPGLEPHPDWDELEKAAILIE
jgi:L-alanine-DL-glutamate epimerase-like enolase superfamily enzyme